jgi:hypothetical protein
MARLAVVAVALILSLLLCELVVRIARPQTRYVVRDELPPSLRLPARSYTSVSTEWRTRIEINELGFHDRDHGFERPTAGLRILIAGDSFSEAAQLPIDETWWDVAGRRIEADSGQPVEVINCGMAGVGTAAEWATYRTLGRRYGADVVLLPIYLENDVVDNSHELQGEPGYGLFYELRSGQLTPMELPPTSGRGESSLWRTSHLLRLVGRMLYVRAEAAHRIDVGGGYPRDLQIYLADAPPAWERGWELTEALVRALARDVEADGATLLATVIPAKAQVEPARWQALLEAYPPMGEEDWDLDGPRRRMGAVLDDVGVPWLDLTPALTAAAGEEPLYFDADIHWTALGNRVAGEATAEFVLRPVGNAGEPALAGEPE